MIALYIMKESECGSYLEEIKSPLKAVVVIYIYIIFVWNFENQRVLKKVFGRQDEIDFQRHIWTLPFGKI